MAVIALTSDKGSGKPESNIMAMRLRLSFPEHTIVSVTEDIKAHDVVQAADTIKYFRDEFPVGTIHIAWVDTETTLHKRWLVAMGHQGYLITPDNGLIPAMGIPFDKIFEYSPEQGESVPDTLIFLIQQCQPNTKLSIYPGDLLAYPSQFLQGDYEFVDQILRGRIIYIDQFGNLVTSISKSIFNEYASGKRFEIILTRHDKHRSIQKNYSDKEIGAPGLVCRFNRLGRLEIALNRENASQLLGLRIGKPVMIEFYSYE